MLLAFETSAKAASVALFDGENLLGESYQNTGLTHSQTLLTMAEDLMKNCGISAAELTAVAVAAGPGSFTGVRIGVAAAKGLAWGREIPCYGVSTLQAMALGLGVQNGYILCAMDARRNQVYTALFSAESGVLTPIIPDSAMAIADLQPQLEKLNAPIYTVGDGSLLCYEKLKEMVPKLCPPVPHRMHQRASGVGLAALREIAAGNPGNGETLTPNYLRLSQAERERQEKMKEV